MTRSIIRILAVLLAFATLSATAQAQSYPNRTIRMMVPSTPGSPTDVLARLLAQRLSVTIGQSVIVEDKPGAGGAIGTKAVIAADPDGYTLLFTEGGKHLMTPALYDNLTYDVVADLAPVATVGGGSFVMVIAPDVPARTVSEFIAYAKANPNKLNFGFGQGTLPHMLGESLKATTGADIASIPYKGGALAVADMLGGRIQLNFGTTATLLPLIQQGSVRALAVTSAARNADLPDVPTMTESGFPGLQLNFWMAVWAPKKTPQPVIDKLNADINMSLTSPELIASMAKTGFATMPQSPHALEAQIAAEAPKWVAVAKTAGVKGD